MTPTPAVSTDTSFPFDRTRTFFFTGAAGTDTNENRPFESVCVTRSSSGKSTNGRQLARRMLVPFVDSDYVHEQ